MPHDDQPDRGPLSEAVGARMSGWTRDDVVDRLRSGDPGLWGVGSAPEFEDRLGWLTLPERMRPALAGITDFAAEVAGDGITDVVLLGMGGSSLAPEVFARVMEPSPGSPSLTVADSTHPAAVAALTATIDPSRTLFLVSSKSGTTIETLSLLHHFWAAVEGVAAEPGPHFAAVTDPGSSLAVLGEDRGFRRVFEAIPEVGGRYSALTHFGLVPAALLGTDPAALLDAAAATADGLENGDAGLELGALLGEGALAGRDKATWVTSPALSAFPDWMEQLVAESTGKQGTGIVPVVGEHLGPPAVYGHDRVFVFVELEGDEPIEGASKLRRAGHPVVEFELAERTAVAAEMYRSEVAVALAGAILQINPFDQPDVERSKELTRDAMAGGGEAGPVPSWSSEGPGLEKGLAALVESLGPGGYFCIQAFLAPTSPVAATLDRVRHAVRNRFRVATTVGFGPRFLHSTGQLHKGGPATGVFLQIIDDPEEDVDIPSADYTFGRLIRAQADGDFRALVESGRQVVRVQLGADVNAGLTAIEKALT